jgi:tellurite methyltransferase
VSGGAAGEAIGPFTSLGAQKYSRFNKFAEKRVATIRDNSGVSILSSEDWAEYYQAMLSRPLHPHYENLDPHLPDGGDALDLGCGVGQGVVHLLEKGFTVTAVDVSEEALGHLRDRLPADSKVSLLQSEFEEFEPGGPYDVVVAHYSLFFLPKEKFDKFWPKVVASVKKGGLLSTQLLGLNDEWSERGYSLHAREEVEKLLEPFEILFLDEVERDGQTAVGTPKHWHIYHIVARKR